MSKPRFVAVPEVLWSGMSDKKKINGNALLVFNAIMQNFPRMFPSVKELCRRTALCRHTVFKYLKRLEELKVIKRTRRLGTSNAYEINPSLLTARLAAKMKNAVKEITSRYVGKNVSRPPHGDVRRFRRESTTTHISTVFLQTIPI